MRARTTLAVVGAFIVGAACATGAGVAVASSNVHHTASTPGDWHGFTPGEVIVCPSSNVETDQYAPGDDPAMPHGGWWAHCDGDAYLGSSKTSAATTCAGAVALLDDARHSSKGDQPEGLGQAVAACSNAVGGF